MSDFMMAILASQTVADTTPPANVGAPTPSSISYTTLTLTWIATTDNVGVTGYKIYQNGGLFADVGNVLTYNLTGISSGSQNVWKIVAYDAAGNNSNLTTTFGTTVNQLADYYVKAFSTVSNANPNTTCSFSYNTSVYLLASTPSIGASVYTTSALITTYSGDGKYYHMGAWACRINSSGAILDVTECIEI